MNWELFSLMEWLFLGFLFLNIAFLILAKEVGRVGRVVGILMALGVLYSVQSRVQDYEDVQRGIGFWWLDDVGTRRYFDCKQTCVDVEKLRKNLLTIDRIERAGKARPK